MIFIRVFYSKEFYFHIFWNLNLSGFTSLLCHSFFFSYSKKKKQNFFLCILFAYLSLWNFKLCTTCGLFCRKFHKCSVSSAVAVTSAPSLTKNTMWSTAQADSPSCRTWQSTPGFPNLFYQKSFCAFWQFFCVVVVVVFINFSYSSRENGEKFIQP